MRLDPVTCRTRRVPMGYGLNFRDWLHRLEGSGRLPSPLSPEEFEERERRFQEEIEADPLLNAQEWEAWLAEHELSTEPPQTYRQAREHARRICDSFEHEEIPRLRREIEQLESRGASTSKGPDRRRLTRLRSELAHADRLVNELWNVAHPAFIGSSFGVPWPEYELRKQGRGPDGEPLLDCYHCKKPDAFASEYEKFVHVGRCADCRQAGAENRAEIHRRQNEPTWLDHLKGKLNGGD